MHTLEIPEKNKTIALPSCWEECTREQSDYILQRAFEVVSGTIDFAAFRIYVFAHLTGFEITPQYHVTRRLAHAQHEEITATIYRLAEQLCAWPFTTAPAIDDEPPRMELNIDTVKNMLTKISAGGNSFYGPADLLGDLTFGEFRAAVREMDAHIAAAKDPDTASEALDALNRFMAVLYRPGQNHRRSAFDATETGKYALLTRAIPLWQKQTTLLWFSYCIKYIQSEDIIIDGQTINLAVLFPKSTAASGTAKKGIGWAGLLFDVAKEGIFGDAEKTDKAGLFDILIYLYKNHLDNKEMERKFKNRKK
ncbi:MAG TPA: hypothetical protein VNQ80_12240 [Parapedobacter sp.]|uniref:hypothetical protein n=1 Tax=Parapedobacter sp. TaxID=1958893 RepID=UPI002C2EDD9A|nr:hypothetical protein [Parapedobacter sp.]HWK58106.1 hypothetical protein [Parapedobacter sp.]